MNKEILIINKEAYLNKRVIGSFKNVKYSYLIPPFVILLICFLLLFFLNDDQNFISSYISIQKDAFLYLNSKLSSFPYLQYNLTQLGDVIILFPFFFILIFYVPKLWEAILTSSFLSLITAYLLKRIFSIPRPAAIIDTESFTIIGKTLNGNTSLPSGHSMTFFILITLLLLAFMPKKNACKVIWSFTILTIGFIITFSRVGVGAHYPLDVIIGSTFGYILAIIGIKISIRLNWTLKLKFKTQFIILILILLLWFGLIIQKIATNNIFIIYLSLFFLLITLYITLKKYVQNKN